MAVVAAATFFSESANPRRSSEEEIRFGKLIGEGIVGFKRNAGYQRARDRRQIGWRQQATSSVVDSRWWDWWSCFSTGCEE
jgi:hypothetical protein